MKTIRIESDGTPAGTKVFDTESGQRLHGIKKVTWEIAVNEAASATVTFACPEITAAGIVNVTGVGEFWERHQRAGELYETPTDSELLAPAKRANPGKPFQQDGTTRNRMERPATGWNVPATGWNDPQQDGTTRNRMERPAKNQERNNDRSRSVV